MKAPENLLETLSSEERAFVREAEKVAERLRPILEHMG